MIRRNQLFFATGDCGCSGSTGYTQTGNDCATFPVQGALVADNRYYSLATSPAVKLLGVPSGSNAQSFLKPTQRGIVMVDDGGVATVTNAPALTLPTINPLTSNAHAVPSAFKYLMIGNGADPANWLTVAAPTTGTYILQAKNGSFVLSDAGEIPGLNEVGGSATFSSKAVPLSILEDPDNPGKYLVRKLQVIHERLVQGWVDPDTGEQYYRPIPTTAQLKHPLGHFMGLQIGTYEQVGPLGGIIPGGMEQALATGAGAITDGHLVWYSPANKKFYKVPARTQRFKFKNTNDAFAAVPASYTALPGGHMVSDNPITINYPTVRIDGQISFGGLERAVFALFMDGVMIQEFNVNDTSDCTFFYVQENVPLGPHYWEFRWKKEGTGSGGGTIKFSAVMVTTLV